LITPDFCDHFPHLFNISPPVQKKSLELVDVLAGLNLAIARALRKEGNLSLASRHLVLSLQEVTATTGASLLDLLRKQCDLITSNI
jgi:hypothetical protein